jgi:uncharacterized protein YndB with AHSA1/START domain
MKKALKYLALGIVIIVLAFFSLGLIHPSLSYTNTVEVDSTIEEAFDAFTDDSRAAEWLIGYQDYKVLEGAPQTPGSKFLMKFETDGHKMEFIEVLTEFKENEEFSFDMETEFFNGSVQILFEGSSPCTITAHTYNEGTSVFYSSMFYLMKGALKEQSQKNYDLLKEMIEQ